jgi:uncharacterized protein (TIGR03546 family)
MFSWLLYPARLVAAALVAHESPRRLAAGAALGMLLGVVPKGNLTALLLAVALFSIRVNLAAGLATAFVFSWIGMLLDPMAHRLGWQILSHRALQPAFAWCYEVPLAPWSGLNNTVVVGQLVLGLYALYPIYWLALQADARFRAPVAAAICKYRVTRLLAGADYVSRLDMGK